ncbi:MAG: hypothetical protein H6815_04670 [Phycisphaeraceae bacterium]|nr:hypothetical protein [Phycisphaerales bacterium]MCB9859727.1 hypothetical protein [Phycisphaeraceae bacterium]
MIASVRPSVPVILLCSAVVATASGPDWTPNNLDLVFRSGFEPSSELINESSSYSDIVGQDNTVGIPNNWVSDLEGPMGIGSFRIELKEGTIADRVAEIIPDPTQTGHANVLRFWLQTPHEPSSSGPKGRVQAHFNQMQNVRTLYHSVSMYLDEDFALLESYPGTFTWLTLFEYWNDRNWGTGPTSEWPFRVTVDIQKTNAAIGSPLSFHVKGQIMTQGATQVVWEQSAANVPVPIGRWVTIGIYYHEGDALSGRFVMTMIDNAQTYVLFDIHDTTQHPNDVTPNDGVPFMNPMKLYTSGTIVDYVRKKGGALEVLWDDLHVRMRCLADCDHSDQLDVFDYICFGNAFALHDQYADCDDNGGYDIFDYICFGNAYAAGCP